MARIPTIGTGSKRVGRLQGGNLQQVNQPDIGAAITDLSKSVGGIADAYAEASRKRQESDDKTFYKKKGLEIDKYFHQEALDYTSSSKLGDAGEGSYRKRTGSWAEAKQNMLDGIEREDYKAGISLDWDVRQHKYDKDASKYSVEQTHLYNESVNQEKRDFNKEQSQDINIADPTIDPIKESEKLIADGIADANMTPSQIAKYSDEVLFATWEQWHSVNPILATAFWDKNSKKMQGLMGDSWASINDKIEGGRENVNVKTAIASVALKFGDDFDKAMDYVLTEEGIEELGLTHTERNSVYEHFKKIREERDYDEKRKDDKADRDKDEEEERVLKNQESAENDITVSVLDATRKYNDGEGTLKELRSTIDNFYNDGKIRAALGDDFGDFLKRLINSMIR